MMKTVFHLILLFACLSFLSISLQTIKFGDLSGFINIIITLSTLTLTTSPDVSHHDIDKGVLDQGEEDEKGARGHEHVNRLYNNDDYGDIQSFMMIMMISNKGCKSLVEKIVVPNCHRYLITLI